MAKFDVIVVGSGFTGLAAAYRLANLGKRICVIEKDQEVGGLAGTFVFDDGVVVEKFYHHWFNSDQYIHQLISELGLEDQIVYSPTNTGMYLNKRIWKLSNPLDLLRFRPLNLVDRIRLGLVTLYVRSFKNWQKIEHLSIREWLEPLCGKKAYSVIWEPLVKSKFSIFAEDISAVWMWKKLVLRGSTRDTSGNEELAYFRGGFGKLADALVKAIEAKGGQIIKNCAVTSAVWEKNCLKAVVTDRGTLEGGAFLFTTALPITLDILELKKQNDWLKRARSVQYLGNICLVLRLQHPLSSTYWLNVNDPGFPFVGVIEHTNFDGPENYKGSRIAYLSRYLATSDADWELSDDEYFLFALKHLKIMFPKFDESWILDRHIWRSEYAQPVTTRNYSNIIPDNITPYNNVYVSTMAQIYPEDRGTNYAVRDGLKIADKLVEDVA